MIFKVIMLAAAGLLISGCRGQQKAPKIEVILIEGNAEIKEKGGTGKSIKAGDSIDPKKLILVDKNSFLKLKIISDTLIVPGPAGIMPNTVKGRGEFYISYGRALAVCSDSTKGLTAKTRRIESVSPGGSFYIISDPDSRISEIGVIYGRSYIKLKDENSEKAVLNSMETYRVTEKQGSYNLLRLPEKRIEYLEEIFGKNIFSTLLKRYENYSKSSGNKTPRITTLPEE
ncbi:MAG: hypothetical protein ACLFQK_11425, partial [Fibrobacterota bacterium]